MTGAHARAHKAKRRAALQARLRAWARSIKSTADTGQAGQHAGGKRQPLTYSEARPYKKRATAAEMTARRLAMGRRRLGPTAASTHNHMGNKLIVQPSRAGRHRSV